MIYFKKSLRTKGPVQLRYVEEEGLIHDWWMFGGIDSSAADTMVQVPSSIDHHGPFMDRGSRPRFHPSSVDLL